MSVIKFKRPLIAGVALFALANLAFAHGDVAPQPVNTDALPEVGEDWLSENPYRDAGDEVWQTAVQIGASMLLVRPEFKEERMVALVKLASPMVKEVGVDMVQVPVEEPVAMVMVQAALADQVL